MIKIIISVIICGLISALAKFFNSGSIRNQIKFNFTILFALVTVVAFFSAEKIVGLGLITYGLAILLVCICIAILVVIRQNSQIVAPDNVASNENENEHFYTVQANVNPLIDSTLEDKDAQTAPFTSEKEEEFGYSAEESSTNTSSEQEAIDELIKQFFKQNEEQQPEVSDLEDTVSQELSIAASIEISDNKKKENQESIAIIPEATDTKAAEEVGTMEERPENNEDILLNHSWKQVLASLEETAVGETEEGYADFDSQEDNLVSDLSALLKDEMGESAEKLMIQSKPVSEHDFQARVHKNKLENEKPNSIVLKMEELVVAADANSLPAKDNSASRQSSYLFELEELIDPNAKN